MSQQRFDSARIISPPSSQNGSFTGSTVGTKNVYSYEKQFQSPSSTNLRTSDAKYSISQQNSNNFYKSNVGSGRNDFYTSNVSDTSSLRNINIRDIKILSQERLKFIADNFIKVYGSGGQIKKHDIEKIQQIAHSNCMQQFNQDQQSINQLSEVLDQNTRDKRIDSEDIYFLCRRYLNCEKKPIIYTPMVQERLSVARRLFKQFDVEKKGFLTEKQVPNLLSQTYKTLGKDFKATEDDIKSWMKLADGDGDGHVTLVQYERSIIRALKKQGIKIYQD